jgi:hypothetical protein
VDSSPDAGPAAALAGFTHTYREKAMRKIVLNAEALAVESFETEAVAEAPGTVEGHEIQWTAEMNGYTCQAMTCDPPSCPAFSCISQCDRNCFGTWDCTRMYLDGFCV